MFTFEYPVTKSFVQRWFAPSVFVGAFIILVLLSTLNVALTGYETITTFESDFNFVRLNWYDRWVPSRAPKPGTMCDPQVLNIGDTFLTNYTLFQWTIQAIRKPNAARSGLAYRGTTLEACDVDSIYLNGDLRTWTLGVSVVVRCEVPGVLEVSARSDFALTSLPGSNTAFLGLTANKGVAYDDLELNIQAIDALTYEASTDLALRAKSFIDAFGPDFPVVLSLKADYTFCPASLSLDAPCALQVPTYEIRIATAIYPNTTMRRNFADVPESPTVIDESTFTVVSNLLQTIYASIRLDLGNSSPNNLYLNASVTDSIIYPSFPAFRGIPSMPSGLYATRKSVGDIGLTLNGPAQLQMVYLCRLQRRKAFGSLFISVLVATLSMFSTAWAIFLYLASSIEKRRNPQSNICDGGHDNSKADPLFEGSSTAVYGSHLQTTQVNQHTTGNTAHTPVFNPWPYQS